MCLIAFAYQVHPEHPIILAANRDEFYSRATQNAHWWPDHPDLLAGKDLEANGTWMGVSRSGLIAAVTNVREPDKRNTASRSRGELPREFLQQQPSITDYNNYLINTQNDFQGYNLIYGSGESLWFFSNRIPEPQALAPGIYGLSNASLNTPWPKVEKIKKSLKRLLDNNNLSTPALLQMMASTSEADDSQLPSTGVSLEWERRLSAICIHKPDYGYGTRSTTALIISHSEEICFHERVLAPEAETGTKITFTRQEKTAP
jgi:uncharacterized protein with NRDE domain